MKVLAYLEGAGEAAVVASSRSALNDCELGWRGFGCCMGMPLESLPVVVAMTGKCRYAGQLSCNVVRSRVVAEWLFAISKSKRTRPSWKDAKN